MSEAISAARAIELLLSPRVVEAAERLRRDIFFADHVDCTADAELVAGAVLTLRTLRDRDAIQGLRATPPAAAASDEGAETRSAPRDRAAPADRVSPETEAPPCAT